MQCVCVCMEGLERNVSYPQKSCDFFKTKMLTLTEKFNLKASVLSAVKFPKIPFKIWYLKSGF